MVEAPIVYVVEHWPPYQPGTICAVASSQEEAERLRDQEPEKEGTYTIRAFEVQQVELQERWK
jgi:hypothetical protein